MKKDVKQLHFFDWFYNNVTCPTVVTIIKRYNTFYSDPEQHQEQLQYSHQCDKFVLWGDSDIPYLQQMTNPVIIENSMNKGIHSPKIGVKITETSQPLDLGPFFKILKMSGRNSTSVGTTSDMTCTVDNMFKKLSMDKGVILSTGKLNDLKDCIICTPNMMPQAFTTRKIQKAFVSSGMLDHRMKLCPDLHGIIQSFKVYWSKTKGGTNWFKTEIPAAILQFYKCGEILEYDYDERSIPIDFDLKGNLYRLNDYANNMSRSTVLYHPTILSDK